MNTAQTDLNARAYEYGRSWAKTHDRSYMHSFTRMEVVLGLPEFSVLRAHDAHGSDGWCAWESYLEGVNSVRNC